MKRLDDALAGWKPGTGRRVDPILVLASRWTETVGEKVARGSHPSAIEGSTLVITARSSAWVAQLGFLETQILTALRAADPATTVSRIRPVVGRVQQTSSVLPKRSDQPLIRRKVSPQTQNEEPLTAFRRSVEEERRAKLEAGWKECLGCGALLPGNAPARCTACTNARNAERERHISRLLYEMPWLGFSGTADYIDGLSELEYRAIRRRLLSRWRQALNLALKRGVLSRDGRERVLASSYLVLKSGLHPDRIAEATIRAEFGDEMYTLLYATNG